MNATDKFNLAKRGVIAGRYKAARRAVKNNPPSDQRIIERRIEQAMANDANRNHSTEENT